MSKTLTLFITLFLLVGCYAHSDDDRCTQKDDCATHLTCNIATGLCINPCMSNKCGTIDGVTCGTCSDEQICSDQNICINPICEQNSDCPEDKSCYAGYCSTTPPLSGMLVKLQLVDQNDPQTLLTCSETDIKTIQLQFKRETYLLDNTNNENSFPNNIPYRYTYEVDCNDISTSDLGTDRGYYIGGDLATYPGEAQAPMQDRNYVMIANFKDADGNILKTKEYSVSPAPTNPEQPENSVTAEIEKIVKKPLNIIWQFNGGGVVYSSEKNNTAEGCSNFGIDTFKIAFGAEAEADEDNSYPDYLSIPCSANWQYTTIITEDQAIQSTLFIYAVSRFGVKVGQVETSINLDTPFHNSEQNQIDLMFSVKSLSNK